MADRSQLNSQFWQDLHEQVDGKRPHRSFQPQRRQKQQTGRNRISRKLVTKPNGARKLYTGSGSPQKKGNNNFVQIPLNNLNIMDYANWRGYPFRLINTRNGANYSLGIDPKTMQRTGTPGSDDLSSVKVALHPQPVFDDHGKPRKDKNGRSLAVTGQGGYYRFSRGDSGSLISIIKDIEKVGTKEAYSIKAQMVNEYGQDSKFDPFDNSMNLPRNPQGESVHTTGNYSMKSKRSTPKVQRSNRLTDFNELNRRLSDLGHHLLNNTAIGEPSLQNLHQLGYQDDQIKDARLGWMPKSEIFHKAMKQRKLDRGVLIQSQLFNVDQDGKLSERFAGQYVKPIIDNRKIVGIQGYDERMNPTQKTFASGKYRPDLGDQLNSWNDDFKNNGKKFNRTDEKGRSFVKGYLCKKRGITYDMVDRMMDDGYIRVGLGRPGDPKSAQKAQELQKREDDLYKHRRGFVQKQGKTIYQNIYKKAPDSSSNAVQKTIQHYGQEAYNKKASELESQRYHQQYLGRDFPAYIEFPHRLNNDFTENRPKDVGADRIQFDPKSKDYKPFETSNGQQYKKVERGGMHNYGYNFTCGNSQEKGRDLYVFEAPVDAISYADMYRRPLRLGRHASDILSLSGSGSKANTISNFMNNKYRETGDGYRHIYFATDNDIHGQQLVQEFTENSRVHWDHDKSNRYFSTLIPPYKKDWNDTRKFYADPKNDPKALKDKKVEHNMDELNDKILHDNTKGMTDTGKKHMGKISQSARNLFLEYENHGERARTPMSKDVIQNIQQEKKQMKRDNPKDANIYDDFQKNIGDSFSPKEIVHGMRRLYDQGMLFQPDVQQRENPRPQAAARPAPSAPRHHPALVPQNRQKFDYEDNTPHPQGGYVSSRSKERPAPRRSGATQTATRPTRTAPRHHPALVPQNRQKFDYQDNTPRPKGDYQSPRSTMHADVNGDPDPFAFRDTKQMKDALHEQDRRNKNRPGANPNFHQKNGQNVHHPSEKPSRSNVRPKRHYNHGPKAGWS